jgi:IS30 family transposase
MVLIDERPKEVDAKEVPGHWEGDLLIGKNRQSQLGVLRERKTAYTLLIPLKDRSAETVREAFAKAINRLPEHLRKSMTYDQGREMAQHKLLTKQTNMKVYFAHPASPWEKAGVENTNGLLRQYFPKGTDFKTIEESEYQRIQKEFNERPRKKLNWNNPALVFAKLLR